MGSEMCIRDSNKSLVELLGIDLHSGLSRKVAIDFTNCSPDAKECTDGIQKNGLGSWESRCNHGEFFSKKTA